MLAAMILALAHGHAAPAFNGLFYATVALILPVLFLALAVQGTMFEDLVKIAARRAQAYKATIRDEAAQRKLSARTLLGVTFLAGTPGAVAVAILLYGTLGEILAVIALYQQRAAGPTGLIVLLATIFLVIAVAIRPFTTFVGYQVQQVRQTRKERAAGLRASVQSTARQAGAGSAGEADLAPDAADTTSGET